MKNWLAFFMLLFSAPSFAATGTTFIGMIIVVVFVTIMLILYYLVVSEVGSKSKTPAEEDTKNTAEHTDR